MYGINSCRDQMIAIIIIFLVKVELFVLIFQGCLSYCGTTVAIYSKHNVHVLIACTFLQ